MRGFGIPFVALMSVLVLSCGNDGDVSVDGPVVWSFQLNDSTTFSMPGSRSVQGVSFFNGEERITAPLQADGSYHLATFDGLITGHWEGDKFTGHWHDRLRNDYQIPLTATAQPEPDSPWIQPTDQQAWEFYLPASEPSAMGTLLIAQHGETMRGTIATPTGDLRYLTGRADHDGTWTLGTFDGAHLYHLAGIFNGPEAHGVFHSGSHYAAPFRAVSLAATPKLEPQEAELRAQVPFSVSFQATPTEREIWGLSDLPKDVMVIDLMGTWCPNCLDEIRLLLQLHHDYPSVGFMSVAFERNAADFDQAQARLRQFEEALDIPWHIVLGGPADKAEAQLALPFLERVASFPTTVFVHRDGRMYTHSGFNGPATGEAYAKEEAAFRQHIERLLTAP